MADAAELEREGVVVVVGVVGDAADHLFDLDGIEADGGAIGGDHDLVAAQAEGGAGELAGVELEQAAQQSAARRARSCGGVITGATTWMKLSPPRRR